MASNVAIVLIVLLSVAAPIAGALNSVRTVATLGLDVSWKFEPSGPRYLEVRKVAPGSSAAEAGIVGGDRIVAFGSLTDRIALMVQSNIHTGHFLAEDQTVAFSIARGNATIVEHLRTKQVPYSRPMWLLFLRTLIYAIGALLAAGLVLWRPEPITWGFALFVIFGQQPNVPFLELVARAGDPLVFLLIYFALIPCVTVIGTLGLLAFAVRFPERTPPRAYRIVEWSVLAFVGLTIVLFVEFYLGQMHGWPTPDRSLLVYADNYAPAIAAIAIMLRTLWLSRGENRVRLFWAVAGPAVGTLLTLLDILLVGSGAPYAAAAAVGLLSSIAPFSMMYAILRHHVIDVGLLLNRTVAEAVAQVAPEPGVKLDRRHLVRRVALLLSTDLPLNEIYPQLAALLNRFIDTSTMLIVRGNIHTAQLAFGFEDGVGIRPDSIEIAPETNVGRVLQTGQTLLIRQSGELPTRNLVSVGGRETALPQSAIFVPVRFAGTMLGVISVQSQKIAAYDDDDVQLLEACALYLGARIHNDQEASAIARGRAEVAVGYDVLTGLRGRASFDEALTNEWQRSSQLAVLMIDVDLVASFSETYGHVAADVCLREVAGAVSRSIEEFAGIVSRYASETFAAVLPNCDAAAAARAGEAVRDGVRKAGIAHEGSSLDRVTVSVGFASLMTNSDDDPQSIVTLANLQLRAAKQRGGNCTFGEGYESDAQPAERRATSSHALPIPQSAFVGREAEIREIDRFLRNQRLITLMGESGAGKTRLALEIGRRCASGFPDGVRFVELSDLRDPNLLAQSVAYALFPGLEIDVDNVRLAELLRDRMLLLILDDCTVVSEECAQLAKSLLAGTSGVFIIATSHRLLHLDDEVAYPVEGMGAEEGVALVQSLHGKKPDWHIRYPGLPLALEIVAASPEPDIAARCDGLGELLEWTYRSLAPEARRLLRRLSVMNAGWTLQHAAAACGGDLEQLQYLESRSLIAGFESGGQLRFRLHPAIAAFADGLLIASAERDTAQLAHLRYYERYALDAIEQKATLSYQRWTEQQVSEFPNYRVALRYALADATRSLHAANILRSLRGMLLAVTSSCDLSTGLHAAVQTNGLPDDVQGTFWLAIAELKRLRSPMDAMRAARRALDLAQSGGSEGDAAYATWRLASAQMNARGAIQPTMESELLEAVATSQRIGDKHLTVGLLHNVAAMQSAQGRHDDARRNLREAALHADPTDTGSLAELLGSSAMEEFRQRNVDGAVAMWRQAAALDEEYQPLYAALCFACIGRCEISRRDFIAARIALRRGLATFYSAGHGFGVAYSFDQFTRLARACDEYERATRLAGFAAARYELGTARLSADEPEFVLLLDELRSALGPRIFKDEWNRGYFMSLEEAIAEAKAA